MQVFVLDTNYKVWPSFGLINSFIQTMILFRYLRITAFISNFERRTSKQEILFLLLFSDAIW